MGGPNADLTPVDLLALTAEVAQGPYNHVFMAGAGHRARLTLSTAPGPWHHHPNTPETFLVLEGVLVLEFRDGRAVKLPAGSALSVPTGVSHRSMPGGGSGRAVSVSLEAQDQQVILESDESRPDGPASHEKEA
ncbi:Cupin type-2 domain-containing protein [Deinococcus saxicola]|uniref:cupin domain-containing protein n=1 Tax=Deinococcus saxicola TaxID=249406 RepID=UPI0039F14420